MPNPVKALVKAILPVTTRRFLQEIMRIATRKPPQLYLNDLPKIIGKQNPIIVEIGANDGSHTNVFLALFPKASIYCFEPDPRARERFNQKVVKGRDRVKLIDVAISDSNGTTEFYLSSGKNPNNAITDNWDLSSSLKKPKLHLEEYPWCKFEDKIQITTKTLDSWCSEEGIDRIDFIWADVQGAEENLIKGGKQALANTNYFYTEYSDKELYEGQLNLENLLTLLPNFEVMYQYSDDVLLVNKTL